MGERRKKERGREGRREREGWREGRGKEPENEVTTKPLFSFHYSGADTRVSDISGTNPFMIAVEKGHLGVVKAMMRKDPSLVSLSICFGSTVIHWALQKGHQRSAFFKVCFFIFIVFILCT